MFTGRHRPTILNGKDTGYEGRQGRPEALRLLTTDRPFSIISTVFLGVLPDKFDLGVGFFVSFCTLGHLPESYDEIHLTLFRRFLNLTLFVQMGAKEVD